MSSFGRSTRYELKRISGLNGISSSEQTILSTPSNSNYFIFINLIDNISSAATFRIYRTLGTTGTTSSQLYWNASVSTSTEFMEHGSDSGTQSIPSGLATDFKYYDRFLMPGWSLTFNGSQAGYLVYYTEVYFGGLANY